MPGYHAQFDENCISDLHKDAIGVRPSQCWWDNWKVMTLADKQETWDCLLISLDHSNQEAKIREQNAIQRFVALVTKTIANGAKDNKSAYRWLMQASDCNGDWDYFCYQHGLPYNFNFSGA